MTRRAIIPGLVLLAICVSLAWLTRRARSDLASSRAAAPALRVEPSHPTVVSVLTTAQEDPVPETVRPTTAPEPQEKRRHGHTSLVPTLGPLIDLYSDDRLSRFILTVIAEKPLVDPEDELETGRMAKLKVLAGKETRLRRMSVVSARRIAGAVREAYDAETLPAAKAVLLSILDCLASQELTTALAVSLLSPAQQSAELQGAAIAVLNRHASEPSVRSQLLTYAQEHPDANVRDGALLSVALKGDPGAIEVARWCLEHDSSALVRTTAFLKLTRVEPDQGEALACDLLARDPDPRLREACVSTLAAIGTDSAWDRVRSEMETDASPIVRGTARDLVERRDGKAKR